MRIGEAWREAKNATRSAGAHEPSTFCYAMSMSVTRSYAWLASTIGLALASTACSDATPAIPEGTAPADAALDAVDASEPLPEAGPDSAPEAEPAPDAGPPFDFDGERMLLDVTELASAPYEGRLPGTAGGLLALDYVEHHFEQLGLTAVGDNGFRSPFSFDLWRQTGPSTLDIAGEPWAEKQDYVLLMGSGAGTIESSLVFAGYGLTVPPFDAAAYPDCPLPNTGYDDYEGIDVTGKVVIVLRNVPAGNAAIQNHCPANAAAQGSSQVLWTFGYKAANAALHGASGALIVNRFSTAQTGPIMGTLGTSPFPDFVVASPDESKLGAAVPELAARQTTIDTSLAPSSVDIGIEVFLDAQTVEEEVQTENLLAAVPGTDPELSQEVVVFGAHIDHLGVDPVTSELYAGADDNASGTAVLMELARALSAGLIEPKRTILLASFNAEEEGLWGSCHYVQNPKYAWSQTAAMFSIDMVGLGDGSGVVLFGANNQSFAWLGDVMRTGMGDLGYEGTATVGPILDASDHYCFALAGVPAVLVSSSGAHATYHTPQDTADAIDPSVLEVSARAMWGAMKVLALGEEKTYLPSSGHARQSHQGQYTPTQEALDARQVFR